MNFRDLVSSAAEVRNNTMKIVKGRDGRLGLTPTVLPPGWEGDRPVFSNLLEAREHLNRTGHTLTDVFEYDPKIAKRKTLVGRGSFLQSALQKGQKVELTSYRMENAEQAAMFEADIRATAGADDVVRGLPVQRGEQATLLRVQQDGRYLTGPEIGDFLKQVDVEIEELLDPKLSKRMGTFLTGEGAGPRMELARDRSYTAQIVERNVDIESVDLVKQLRSARDDANRARILREMNDTYGLGVIKGSDDVTRIVKDLHKQVLDKLKVEAHSKANDGAFWMKHTVVEEMAGHYEKIAQRSKGPDADLYRRQAEQLRELLGIGRGRIESARVTGIDILNLDEMVRAGVVKRDEAPALRKALAKGDALFDVTRKMTTDFEFVVDNFTTQIGSSGRGRLIFSGIAETGQARVDLQTVANQPWLYTDEYLGGLTDTLATRVQEAQEQMLRPKGLVDPKSGRLVGPLGEMIESNLRSTNVETQAIAENLQRFLVEGNVLAENPHLHKEGLKMLKDYIRRKSYDIPNIRMEDSLRGHIASRTMFEHIDFLRDTLPGEVRWSDDFGWVMHETDAAKFYAPWGGFDHDDALNGILRYDSKAQKIKAIMSRNPNAPGEWVLVDARLDEDRLRKLVHNMEPQTRPDGKVITGKRLWRDHQRGRVSQHELFTQIFTDITEEIKEAPRRTGSQKIKVEGAELQRLNLEPGVEAFRYPGSKQVYIQPKGKPQIDRVSLLATQDTDYTEYFNRYIQDVSERLRSMAGGERHLLGEYVNAITIQANFALENRAVIDSIKDPKMKARVLNLLDASMVDLEAVIDAQVMNDIGIDPKKVRKAARIARTNTAAAATLMADHQGVSLLDEVLHSDRVIRSGSPTAAAIEEGFETGLQLRRDLGLAPIEKSAIFGEGRISRFFKSIVAMQGSIDEVIGEHVGFRTLASQNIVSREATTDAKAFRKAYNSTLHRLLDKTMGIEEMTARHLEEGWITSKQASRAAVDDALTVLMRTFDDSGVATDRTYRTLLRSAELIEMSKAKNKYSLFGEMFERVGPLMDEALEFARGNEVKDRTTVRALYDVMGQVPLGAPDHARLIDRVLKDSQFSHSVLEELDRGFRYSGRGAPVDIPTQIMNQFIGDSGTYIDPTRGITGLMDSATPVITPQGETTVGRLLHQVNQVGDKEAQRAAAGTLREALDRAAEASMNWASSSDTYAPEHVRRGAARAADYIPGEKRAGQLKESIESAMKVADSKYTRVNMESIRNLLSTPGGKIGGGVGLGMLAMAMVHTIRKKKDHTMEDIQGTPFMPGGTPYEFPGGGVNMPMQSYSPAQQDSGITYQVSTRGGKYDNSFLAEVSSLFNSPVEGSSYDAPIHFQSKNTRDEILRSYR